MKVIRIPTDNPRLEQWKLLSRFSYAPNIRSYSLSKGRRRVLKKTINYVAGCIRQSEEYFTAALTAPLDISPLLLYYGATNLTSGAITLVTGKIPEVFHHGMTLLIPGGSRSRVADCQVTLARPSEGAIQAFAKAVDNLPHFDTSGSWTVLELLGSIPALSSEFQSCYAGELSSCLPVKPVKREMHGVEFMYDEVDMALLRKYGNEYATLMLISNLNDAYLRPQINVPDRSANLYYKPGATDIGIYSIFGEKFLPLNHTKNGHLMCPNQLLMMLMALFSLGTLSRYHPSLWNPFVRSDETGERAVVERFLAICQRFLPNLVLNYIESARVQFAFEIERELA